MSTDTIAALSTPEGTGAIAVIRVSGPRSIPVLGKIFTPARKTSTAQYPAWKAIYGHIRKNNRQRFGDEVIVTVFRNPNSYTREDMVEISCHGGQFASQRILESLFVNGVRPAQPGEFTRRALLNGRIDLIQAEAIDKIIHAQSEEEYEQALYAASHEHEESVTMIKNRLLTMLEELEVSIEDPDDHEIDESFIHKELTLLQEELDAILKTSKTEGARHLFTFVIFGRKNAGKSTLFNNIIEQDRSIVTEIPGTTRDVVEAETVRTNCKIRIIDTAGYGGEGDPIDELAMKKAERSLEDADVVLFMIDGTQTWTDEDMKWVDMVAGEKTLIRIWNKKDLKKFKQEIIRDNPDFNVMDIAICAHDREDVLEVEKEMDRILLAQKSREPSRSAVFLMNERQTGLIKTASGKLVDIQGMLADGQYPELVAFELHQVRKLIDEWLGINTPPEILDSIFNRFCVGK